MKNLLTTLLYTTLILFSSLSMAAAEKASDQTAPCTEGIVRHHVGPPGKGIVHYDREDCIRVEFAAFERLPSDDSKDAVTAGHEVKIGKPAYNRRSKN